MDSWKPAGFYDRGIDHGGNVSCVKVSGGGLYREIIF